MKNMKISVDIEMPAERIGQLTAGQSRSAHLHLKVEWMKLFPPAQMPSTGAHSGRSPGILLHVLPIFMLFLFRCGKPVATSGFREDDDVVR